MLSLTNGRNTKTEVPFLIHQNDKNKYDSSNVGQDKWNREISHLAGHAVYTPLWKAS